MCGGMWRSEFGADFPHPVDHLRSPQSAMPPPQQAVRGGLSRAEGPLQGSDKGLLYR